MLCGWLKVSLNSNLILLIREGDDQGGRGDNFKFQSDSINTFCIGVTFIHTGTL